MYMVKTAFVIEVILLAAVCAFRFCLRPRERDMVAVGDVLLIVAIPLVGLFGRDKNVLYGFLAIAPLFWAADPARLAKRYVLALVSFPELSEPYWIGSAYLGVWSALLALNIGSFAALVIARRGALKPIRAIDMALWLVFVVAILMLGRGLTIGGTLRVVASTFFLVVPPYFIMARAITSARVRADVIGFVVLGGICNACIALVESLKHWALYENLAGALHIRIGVISANLSLRAGLLRAGGAFINYETLGLFCGMSLMAAIAVRRRFTTGGFCLIAALLVAGLLASQARSAWIATGAGLVIQALYDRRWPRLAALLGGMGLVAALTVILAQRGGMASQVMGASGHGESTGEYRQRLLNRGIEEVQRHPWTGQTLDQIQVTMNDLRQGEHIIDLVNTHLTVVLVGGFGAFAAWVLAWGIPLVLGWRGRPARLSAAEASASALPFALLSTLMIFLAFTSPVDRGFPFIAMSMGLMSVGLRLNAQPTGGRSERRRQPPLSALDPASLTPASA